MHPDVVTQFSSGYIAVHETMNVFSAMEIDQCHDQVNALMNNDGGAVCSTESPQAMEMWMVVGAEIACV